jgi:alpha-glucuronidase
MWFARASGIADSSGRVGHYPGRLEAEAAELSGYVAKPVIPWEAASGGAAVECAASRCAATFRYDGEAGWRDLIVQYFDTNNGVSRFEVRIGNQVVAQWSGSERFPTRKPDGSSSTRQIIRGVALRPGDRIQVVGIPDGAATAALDYLEIVNAEIRGQ